MKKLRIKQAFIYTEDDYWTWQVVDIGGREYFADTLYFTREDAQRGIVDALESIVACLDGNKKHKMCLSLGK
jgi:hypothetical protein